MSRTSKDAILLSLTEFISENRRLLVFLVLFIGGAGVGIGVFLSNHALVFDELSLMFSVQNKITGFQQGISVLFSSCMEVLLLLLLLFLSGLCVYGAPLTVLVPVFYGLGFGLTEAYYYASSGGLGIALIALQILPHTLLAVAALIMACSESLRMSLLLSRQLLPSGSMGGLWQDFKLYCMRFLLFVAIVFTSGVMDVILRMICTPLFL